MPMMHLLRAVRFAAPLFAGWAFAAPSGPAESAAATLTGTLDIVCTVATDASTPIGSTVNASVDVRASGLSGFETISASQSVAKTSDSQSVTLVVPYRWTFSSPQKSVYIFVTFSRSLTATTYASASTTLSIPLPANGATTVVDIPVRI